MKRKGEDGRRRQSRRERECRRRIARGWLDWQIWREHHTRMNIRRHHGGPLLGVSHVTQ